MQMLFNGEKYLPKINSISLGTLSLTIRKQ